MIKEDSKTTTGPKQLHNKDTMSNIGFFQFDADTDSIFWNDILKSMYEVPLDFKPTLQNVFDFIGNEQDKTRLQQYHIEALEECSAFEIEHEIITKKGGVRHFWVFGQPAVKNGKCTKIFGTVLDITNRKNTEIELKQKHQQLSLAEEIAQIGYWEWDPILDHFIWSDNLYRIFGLEKGNEMSLKSLSSLVHPDDKERVALIQKDIIKTKIFKKFTYRIIPPQGRLKTLEVVGQIVCNDNGNVIKVIGVSQDISNRISIKNELVEKNHYLTLAEKMAMIGFWQWTPEHGQFIWSDNLYRMFGYDIGIEINLESFNNRIHPEDKDGFQRNVNEFMETEIFKTYSYRIVLPDGSVKVMEVLGQFISSAEENKPKMLGGVIQDITERAYREIELNKNNKLLNLSSKIAQIGYWHWKLDSGEILWSDNLYHLFELEVGQVITKDFLLSIVHPNDQETLHNALEESLRTKNFKKIRHRRISNNGAIKTLELNGEFIFNDKGEVIEIIGTSQDVTENIKKENELIEKNNALNFAEEIAKIGNWKMITKDQNIIWSDYMYQIFEIEKGAKLTPQTFLSKIHPEDLEEVLKTSEQIFKSKTYKKHSFRIIKNDGSIRTLNIIGEVILDNIGDVQEIRGTIQDITEQLMFELKFRGLLESAPDAFVIIDENSIIQFINKEAEKIYGYGTHEMVGSDFLTIIPQEFHEQYQIEKEYLKKEKQLTKIDFPARESYIINKNGDKIPIQLKASPVETSTGYLIMIAIRNITKEKRNKERILEANKRLEKSTKELTIRNKQLAEFNHITSHNLRSPVSNLNALLGLYKDAANEDKKTELFGKFETVINHLTLTLNSLIESLKINNKLNQVTTELNFLGVYNKTKEILAAEILNTKATIEYDFSTAPTITYNQIYLESIFLNLISNALKYKSPERTPKISLKTKIKNGNVILSIKDNGLGIDLERHGDKLFGLNKVFHRHPEAQGIGLFLTKAQVEAMGGSISVKSKVNVGTTFFVSFK